MIKREAIVDWDDSFKRLQENYAVPKLTVEVSQLSRWVWGFGLVMIWGLGVVVCVMGVPYSAFVCIGMFLLGLPNLRATLRREPLYEVDARGINDLGTTSRGFGMIDWRNIESVRLHSNQHGMYLMVQVNNLGDLLERRHFLMRPLSWLNCQLSAMMGGHLFLPVSHGNVDPVVLMSHISDCSRRSVYGRDVVQPPRKWHEDLVASLIIVAILVALFALFSVVGAKGYEYWTGHRKPTLEVLGGSKSFSWEVGLGKQVAVEQVIVQNFGDDSTGLKVELSGTAFDKGLLKNPRVLLSYDGQQTGHTAGGFMTRTREVLPLHQDHQKKRSVWVGTSHSARLAHKADLVSEAIQLLTGQPWVGSGPIGFWSDVTRPNMTVELFADSIKSGSGNVHVTVTPTAFPSQAVSQMTPIKVQKFAALNNGALYSVTVPKNYPISLYPNGQIMWLSPVELRFDSTATSAEIAAYYRHELKKNGWKVSEKRDGTYQLVSGTKGHTQIEIKIAQVENHTPVWVTINSDG